MQRKAIEWAKELIESEATTPRASIAGYEVVRERLVYSRFQRAQVYRLELDIWEPVGLARLIGRRVYFPADREPWRGGPPPRPPRPDEALEVNLLRAVSQATRGAAQGAALRCGSWAHDEEGTWIWVERHAPDGRLALELDPETGVRLGCFLPFRGRNSRRCAAISRPRAVQEGRARLRLPSEAVQVYTRLCKRPGLRVWSLRWSIGEGPWRGQVRAELNARTGEVIEQEVRLWPRPACPLGLPAERGEAEREIRRQVLRVVGREAEVGLLVPGVSDSGEGGCWLAVVRSPSGTRRVTYYRGEVRFGPERTAS